MQTRQGLGVIEVWVGAKSLTKGLHLVLQLQQGRKASRNAFAPSKRGTHIFAYAYIWYMVYVSGMSGASFALLQLQLQLVAAACQLIRCECDFNCCPQSTPCAAFAKLESVWRQTRNLWTSSSL